MNIGIDARLLERRMTGIGRSLKNLLEEIPKYDNKNRYLLFSYEPIPHNHEFFINVTTVRCLIPQKVFSPIWSMFILPFYLKKMDVDVLFSINQAIPLIKIKKCKYVSVLNDVIYKKDKNYFPFIYRMYLRFLCYFSTKISDAIITISEYSKNDILKHYDLNPDKVKVVYPSINTEFIPLNLSSKERNEIKSYLHLPKYVILYVGVIENRKNIFGILNVADEIYKRNKNIGFLLVGRLGYGNRKILSAIKKKKNVILQTSIDDLMLKKIYNISDIFLFPSFYEGFGYPPLEAMRCGIPVIASNNTSLKEVIGDGGILRDPHDHHIMADDIMNILKDEELYAEMQGKGMKQAKKFTSENYVLGMLNVFNSFSKQ